MGDGVYIMAFLWLSLKLSNGKGLAMGGIFSVYTLGELIFGLVSGPIVDRYDKKRILVFMDLSRGLLLGFFYMLVNAKAVTLLHLYVCTFLFSMLSPFFHRAEFSILPQIVSSNQLLKTNGLLIGTKRLMRILSPMIGGLLIQLLGIEICFLFDAVSFLFSSFCISLISVMNGHRQKRPRNLTYLVKDMKSGYRIILNSPFFLTLTLYAACINFVGAPVFPLLPIISEKTCNGASGYGVMMSLLSAGLITSSFLVLLLDKWLPRIKIMLSGLAMSAIAVISISFGHNLLTIAIPCFIMGMGLTLANLPIQTLFQETLPSDKIGAASGFVFTIAQIGMPISMALSGYMIQLMGINLLLNVLGISMLVGALIGLLLPQLKQTANRRAVT